jgi:hypothetical protein
MENEMSDDKKPDRFEEKAHRIIEACHWPVIADWTLLQGKLVNEISEALREESKTQLVSEEAYEILAEQWAATQSRDITSSYLSEWKHAFREGFRKAMELRATEDIAAKWPSEQDLNNYCANALRPEYSKGVQACYQWLKEKLGIE